MMSTDPVINMLFALLVSVTLTGFSILIMLAKIHNRLEEIASDTLQIAPHSSEAAETLTQISDATSDMVTLLDTPPIERTVMVRDAEEE
jgi:hypothetical protein